MLERYGRFCHRRRWWLVAACALVVAAAAYLGSGVFGAVEDGGFDDPASESVRAGDAADQALGRGTADVVVLYRSATLTVDDARFQAAVTDTLDALPAARVARTVTYWSAQAPHLASVDRHATYAVLTMAGTADQQEVHYRAVASSLDAPGLTTQVGGRIPTFETFSRQVNDDLGKAEAISLPVLLVLLVVIFGSLTAASLPLAIGGVGILGGFATLRALAEVTHVSVFAVNVVTLIGLGLAIDYGLLMVSRFREELRGDPVRGDPGGTDVPTALARTLSTAGRTIAVSGVTVAVSLAGLTFFDIPFLRSMGLGGVAVVTIDMLAALTLLPALLAVLGRRVDAVSVRGLRRRFTGSLARPGRRWFADGWARLARAVMRHPMTFAARLVLLLLVLALPVLHLSVGATDARVLPAGTEARVVSESLVRDFPSNATAPVQVVLRFGPAVGDAGRGAARAYLARVRDLAGVQGADVAGAGGDVVLIAVRYDSRPTSPTARRLVGAIRDLPPPAGVEVLVGGETAGVADRLASMAATLPWTVGFVAAVTFVLLALAFGSVLLPVKAIVMNVLSLAATFGVVVWIFQDGHLSDLLGFTPTGSIDPSMPVLMLAIVFGLSTDYEVFLLSRVREHYDLTGDNTAAVAHGMQRTGGIITSAAVLLLAVIGAFSVSGVTSIKLIGVGMFVAILLDATVVRALLVPATMRLMGRANWWAPAPLRALYARSGLRGSVTATPARGNADPTPAGRRRPSPRTVVRPGPRPGPGPER